MHFVYLLLPLSLQGKTYTQALKMNDYTVDVPLTEQGKQCSNSLSKLLLLLNSSFCAGWICWLEYSSCSASKLQ
jgi:hypothetical protein